MRLGNLIFIILLVLADVCHAAPKLSASDRARLLEERTFHLLPPSTPLPAAAASFCSDANGRLAMPGARWAPTDVLSQGGALPSRRLIWAASNQRFLVIHYEQGGFAHTYGVVVLGISSDGTAYELAWRVFSPWLKDYTNFTRALAANELQEEPELGR